MNVNQFLTELEAQSMADFDASDLLDLRQKIFLGFCQAEAAQGGIDPSISISLPKGQEAVRTLFARTMEELLEAYKSIDPVHFQEELIDAVNFGTSIAFLNLGQSGEVLRFMLGQRLDQVLVDSDDHVMLSPGKDMIPNFFAVAEGFHDLLESLRNRAWQNGAQHSYFNGHKAIVETIVTLWSTVLLYFPSRDDFIRMYLAKAKVLEFRLSTKY